MAFPSENFSRKEFACRCGECGRDVVDVELLSVLQRLRDYYGKPITITSGNRCPNHNENVGGSPKSKHLEGKAADFSVLDVETSDICSLLEQWFPDKYGIGMYSTWVHLDVREKKSRWRK